MDIGIGLIVLLIGLVALAISGAVYCHIEAEKLKKEIEKWDEDL